MDRVKEQTREARTVLLIDDGAADRALVRRYLGRDGRHGYVVTTAETGAEALARFAECRFDLVLLDYRLPDMDGLELLAALRQPRPQDLLPAIFLTGQGDENVAVEAMKGGALDYISKHDLSADTLTRCIENALERVRLHGLLQEKQRALDEAQRREVRMRDEFLSHVSHELRTPLSVIFRFVDLLLDGVAGPLGEEQREYLEIAARNCHQLQRLINDLLESARAREGKIEVEPRATDLAALIGETQRERSGDAAESGLSLVSIVPGGFDGSSLPLAWADPARVRQIVGNLVDNALKFTPPGGRIELSVELAEAVGFLAVTVADTGRGIPASELPTLFERLHQVREDGDGNRGLGFGLYIARRLVERQGGAIEVESTPGEGTTFRFTLPIFTPELLLQAVLEGQQTGETHRLS